MAKGGDCLLLVRQQYGGGSMSRMLLPKEIIRGPIKSLYLDNHPSAVPSRIFI